VQVITLRVDDQPVVKVCRADAFGGGGRDHRETASFIGSRQDNAFRDWRAVR